MERAPVSALENNAIRVRGHVQDPRAHFYFLCVFFMLKARDPDAHFVDDALVGRVAQPQRTLDGVHDDLGELEVADAVAVLVLRLDA